MQGYHMHMKIHIIKHKYMYTTYDNIIKSLEFLKKIWQSFK